MYTHWQIPQILFPDWFVTLFHSQGIDFGSESLTLLVLLNGLIHDLENSSYAFEKNMYTFLLKKILTFTFKYKHASSFPFFISLETPCWDFININLILLQLFNKDWFEMQPNSINKVTNSSKEKKLTLNIHQAQSRAWKGRTHKWLPTNAQSPLLGLIAPCLTVLNWGHYFSFQTDVPSHVHLGYFFARDILICFDRTEQRGLGGLNSR